MSLNKHMHPRNPYKTDRPNFKHLYDTYKTFKDVAHKDKSGNVSIDFKDPTCLKALTYCLLKDRHDIELEIPSQR